MKAIVYKDAQINFSTYTRWQSDFKQFVKKYTDIDADIVTTQYDFKGYPTILDKDQDPSPEPAWVNELIADCEKKFGKLGFDHVFLMIHEDNWKAKRIWGTNYSYKFGPYHVHYCRADRDNPANTFGTLYHEWHHSLDALCSVEAGVNVNNFLEVKNYDSEITHGKNANWKYIRYRENVESLIIMAPYMRQAYAERRRKQKDFLKSTILILAEKALYLLKQLLNRKNGVKV